ncbi:MAG: hypothetical protein ACE14S_04160 [Candidatus Bathyarchaeia archaeon]
MIGLLETQFKLFVHGVILVSALAVGQILLDMYQLSFFVYSPPIGFAFFLMMQYIIQPILLGALNVGLINVLYNTAGWSTELWVNGLFLFLAFSTINLVLQTMLGFSYSITIAIVEVVLLAYPFGLLGRFSNS